MTARRKSELYFEELGTQFDEYISPYDTTRRIQLILEKLIPAGELFERALEVGCGTGKISEKLVPRVGHLTVTDLSEKLAGAVAARLGCTGKGEDACALTFDEATFDLVVSSECIEHTPDPWKALDEMFRVVKPGGVIVVTTPNKLWYPILMLAQTLGLRNFQGNEIWISSREVMQWIGERQLEPLRLGGCHLFPWILPGAKLVLPKFDRYDARLWRCMINLAISVRKKRQQDGTGEI